MTLRRTTNSTIGLSLGRAGIGAGSGLAWGWAVVDRGRPQPPTKTETGDPLALARAAARKMNDADEELTIYIYANQDAYQHCQAARDGLKRADHTAMCERIATQLSREYDIHLCEIK